MTIYQISIITSTGYPYYNLIIKNLPSGIKLYLRFYDYTSRYRNNQLPLDSESLFDLNAGLISALFEFARNMDKKIETLEFRSRKENGENRNNPVSYRGDVLITLQSESYLLDKAVKQKVDLIYRKILSKKIPLDTAERIFPDEEKKIIDILTDTKAREKIIEDIPEINIVTKDFFKAMKEFGLESIVITSFDFSPIRVFGEQYNFKDIEILLRNIGFFPEIEPLQWKYRQSFIKGKQAWVYIINSGVGVEVEGLFEPYYYILIATPDSYLGEFPEKIAQAFNLILG